MGRPAGRPGAPLGIDPQREGTMLRTDDPSGLRVAVPPAEDQTLSTSFCAHGSSFPGILDRRAKRCKVEGDTHYIVGVADKASDPARHGLDFGDYENPF